MRSIKLKRPRVFVFSILLFLFLGCKETQKEDSDSIATLLFLAQTNANNVFKNPCRSRSAIDQVGIYNAKQIVSAPADIGTGFQDSSCASDGILGLGNFNGSLDVFTLDTNGAGASLVLGWNGKKVQNTAGNDFIVFENPFQQNSSSTNVFLEPVIVEVGNDLSNWCGWNPTYAGGGTFSTNPANWLRFAGLRYVDYNQEKNPMDSATLFASGGGDGFDLLDANFGASGNGCNGALTANLQTNGFLYVRLTSAKAILTTLPIPGANENPDIDGVIAKQLSP